MNNVIEIIKKKECSSAEILYVIQEYIKEKKGQSVKINEPRDAFNLQLMKSAYDTAAKYFMKKT